MRVSFYLDLFRTAADAEWSEKVMKDYFLPALLAADRAFIRKYQPPKLYQSGVRYRREPRGQENWRSVRHLLESGYGDCEDLAAWRLAELHEAGELGATFRVTKKIKPNGFILYHIAVRRADGRIEDPSRRLGMGVA